MSPNATTDWSPERVEQLLDTYPRRRFRPIRALTAIVKLAIDPQDTSQAAELEIALGGISPKATFARFLGTPVGRSVLDRRFSIVRLLDDRESLRQMDPNSVGRHYLHYMESEGLSAQGLIDAMPAYTTYLGGVSESARIFSDHTQRGAHDLYHVLGGYGRDELGEICAVAMAYEQIGIPGYKVITTIGPYVVRRHLRRAGISGDVFAAVREASAMGRASGWIPALDVETVLAEDIDVVRARLNIRPPVHYLQVLEEARRAARWTSGPFAELADRRLAGAA